MITNEPRAGVARGYACGNCFAALTTEVHVLFRLGLDVNSLYLAGQNALGQETQSTKVCSELGSGVQLGEPCVRWLSEGIHAGVRLVLLR